MQTPVEVELKTLIHDCWHAQPSKRPSMAEIVPRVRALRRKMRAEGGSGVGAAPAGIAESRPSSPPPRALEAVAEVDGGAE